MAGGRGPGEVLYILICKQQAKTLGLAWALGPISSRRDTPPHPSQQFTNRKPQIQEHDPWGVHSYSHQQVIIIISLMDGTGTSCLLSAHFHSTLHPSLLWALLLFSSSRFPLLFDRVLYSPGWSPIQDIAKRGLELLTFLPLPAKCWDYRSEPLVYCRPEC